jgi:hypothetical protein
MWNQLHPADATLRNNRAVDVSAKQQSQLPNEVPEIVHRHLQARTACQSRQVGPNKTHVR